MSMTEKERVAVQRYITEDLLTDPVLGLSGQLSADEVAMEIIGYTDHANWACMYGLATDLTLVGQAIYTNQTAFRQMVRYIFKLEGKS
ncbi:hypothetical protein [Loigolactobacillus bifermentans]|nr:hypothetical protein [Loigolactobacillus bifermentans]QGG60103.1 hypothetical protein LB003_06360 [Loigolactobacillus bifermentans]